MSGFLYYIPGKENVSEERLQELGILWSKSVERGGVRGGPDGGAGGLAVFSPATKAGTAPTVMYKPESQIWRKCASGKFWIGYETDNPPGPMDLVRAKVVQGFSVRLADRWRVEGAQGEVWMLPSTKALPSYTGLDDSGVRMKRIHPEFEKFATLGERAFKDYRALRGNGRPEDLLDDNERIDSALECLAQNYTVGPWEADALAILTDTNVAYVLMALIDAPGEKGDAEEAKKKE